MKWERDLIHEPLEAVGEVEREGGSRPRLKAPLHSVQNDDSEHAKYEHNPLASRKASLQLVRGF